MRFIIFLSKCILLSHYYIYICSTFICLFYKARQFRVIIYYVSILILTLNLFPCLSVFFFPEMSLLGHNLVFRMKVRTLKVIDKGQC